MKKIIILLIGLFFIGCNKYEYHYTIVFDNNCDTVVYISDDKLYFDNKGIKNTGKFYYTGKQEYRVIKFKKIKI